MSRSYNRKPPVIAGPIKQQPAIIYRTMHERTGIGQSSWLGIALKGEQPIDWKPKRKFDLWRYDYRACDDDLMNLTNDILYTMLAIVPHGCVIFHDSDKQRPITVNTTTGYSNVTLLGEALSLKPVTDLRQAWMAMLS